MTVRRIHLIRHGQTDWNRDKRVQGHAESQLSDLGRLQASRLAPLMRHHPVTAVHCSSSLRTRQTAALIFGDSGQAIAPCDHIREIYLGPWEGRYQKEVREIWPEQFEHFWHRPDRFLVDGAETFEQVQERAMRRMSELLDEPHEEIAVVSHGVWIKTVLCAIEGRELGRLWEPPHMHNCAHSIVERDGDALRIIQYAHVDGEDPMQPGVAESDRAG